MIMKDYQENQTADWFAISASSSRPQKVFSRNVLRNVYPYVNLLIQNTDHRRISYKNNCASSLKQVS